MIELWYQALAAEFGIVLETDNIERAKAKLYEARREAQDLDLERLSIVQSPIQPNQLWLIRNNKKDQP